jgi:Xaa-Pro aminopeptidase
LKSISNAEYQQRRQQFMQSLAPNSIAVIASAPMAVMHKDVEYVYRQSSDFFYLTGLNEPDAIAVFTPDDKKYAYRLFLRPRDLAMETWTGRRVGIEGAEADYAADKAWNITAFDKQFSTLLNRTANLYYAPDQDATLTQRILQHWQTTLNQYPRNGTGATAWLDPRPVLHAQRLYKSAAEIDMMREAMQISAKAHETARKLAKVGGYEYEIQAAMEQVFRQQGGDGFAYPSIVASGDNACILHYVENNQKMQDNDLLLIDAGCALSYYNADITRTFPVNGRFTEKQRTLYELVLAAQLAAIDSVQVDNPLDSVHKTAVNIIAQGLLDLGLLTGTLKTVLKTQAYKPFFMHGTSHWLGLDVHDVGQYKENGKSIKLAAGQVLTVEPGIYISPDFQPAKGQPMPDSSWLGIGIRIEDDVLVTVSGHEVLTATTPKSVAEMES